jgi:uncharacterized protein
MSIGMILLLFATGVLGGAINAVAGGATLFTFPALLAAGIPPIMANASSSVALTPGHLSGVLAERAQLPRLDLGLWVHVAIAAVGGAAGALLLLWTPERIFTALVPLLIGVATGIFAFSKQMQAWIRGHSGPMTQDRVGLRQSILVPTTVYGGYFGAGMGVMLMAVFAMTSTWSMRGANAVKNLLGAAANWAAIVIFAAQGLIAWQATGVMLAGAVFGGLAGGRMLSIVPVVWIRRFVILMGTLMTIVYAWRYWL